MKIYFDHQIFAWQKFGGISRYIADLSVSLSKTSHKISVINPLYVNHYLDECRKKAALSVTGLKVPVFPISGRIYRLINYVLTAPFYYCFPPDIVHETYYSALRVAKKKTKTVLTVYDMIHERFPENFSQKDPTSREKYQAVERADHVICISNQTKKDLIRFFHVAEEKISVIYLGFTPLPTPSAQLNRKPYLLYVGSRKTYKNFKQFLVAYSLSKFLKEQYEIVCFGGGAFTQDELSWVTQHGVNINSMHHVSGDDKLLASYYAAASLFIYPSLYEGFGIPPLEAMSLDCPVVCSNISSIPEVVGDAAVLFDPESHESMTNAMEKVLTGKKLREALIVKGKERVKHFTWQRCTRETLQVYSEVLRDN